MKLSTLIKPNVAVLYALHILLINTATYAAPPTIGGYKVFYGDLHNHSNVSDGTGTPATAYNYAKNTAHLDFFSLADHCTAISSTEWADIKNQANIFNQDGVFTAFWGFEWSSSSNYGHITINNTDDYCTATSTSTNTFTKLCTWLSSRNAIAFFNHPGREDDLGKEFDHFTTAYSDKFVGMELWNKSDPFTIYYYNDGYYTNDNNKSYFDEALTRGWKIGAAGAGDNHSGTWGTANGYRLAVLADTLTRANLLAALKSRRFYSTLDNNIALSFKINGSEMGSTVPEGNSTLQVLATDGNGEIFTEVKLFDKNHNVVNTWTINTTSVNISYNFITTNGNYYYIKVKQTDGNEAISSPIFIEGTLSVSFSYFNAIPNDSGINLSWRTENEVNSLRWIIERSPFGTEEFSSIAIISAKGYSNIPSVYEWFDSTALPGTTYSYRLKEVDIYENTTIFGPINAHAIENLPKESFYGVNIYPNPFASKTTIYCLMQGNNTSVSFGIYNISGQLVKKWDNPAIKSGQIHFTWNGANNNNENLPAGVYLARLKVNNKCFSTKIIKID